MDEPRRLGDGMAEQVHQRVRVALVEPAPARRLREGVGAGRLVQAVVRVVQLEVRVRGKAVDDGRTRGGPPANSTACCGTLRRQRAPRGTRTLTTEAPSSTRHES